MANIINIFHKDVLPENTPPEYEVTPLQSNSDKDEILLYRRGINPAGFMIQAGERLSIPMLPLTRPSTNYKTNPELQREVKKFVADSIPYFEDHRMSVKDGVMAARNFFDQRGTYIYHCLYSHDMMHHLDPVYDYITEAKCMDILKRKRTIILLPEPICAGFLAVKESINENPYASGGQPGRFGMMLAASNVFMITVP